MSTSTLSTKKITLATVKAFVKKNRANLFINVKSSFDGMTDGCEMRTDGFHPATEIIEYWDNTLHVHGAWFVGGSRDYFTHYQEGAYEGIAVSNSCGSFILATRKF